MSKRRTDISPALILLSEDVEDVPKFSFINSTNYLIGRSLESNLTILKRNISRKHCSLRYDEFNNWTLTSHGEHRKAVSVQNKDVVPEQPVVLNCGDKINITHLLFEFKCAPDSQFKCCADFKKARLSSDDEENVPHVSNVQNSVQNVNENITKDCSNDEKTVLLNDFVDLPSTLPISQLPDSSSFHLQPADSTKELPDSSVNCTQNFHSEDLLNFNACDKTTPNYEELLLERDYLKREVQKFKEKNAWQESRINFLEIKFKEKRKLEMELEAAREEIELLEKRNSELRRKSDNFEIKELEFQTMEERFKYREEDERDRNTLHQKIKTLETELKFQKDENNKLIIDVCRTADDITKIQKKCDVLETKLKEKFVISVNNVPANANDSTKPLMLNSFPTTLPFEILRNLFKSSPIADNGIILRKLALEHGAIQTILTCLAVFTHHTEAIQVTDTTNQTVRLISNSKKVGSITTNRKKRNKRSNHCWAKGTGYSSGNTSNSSWNAEQALRKQRSEEKHVTVILQILTSYINPDFKVTNPTDILEDLDNLHLYITPAEQSPFPASFVELIENSCLLPVLLSYLRNDSVLDIGRRVTLYRAVFVLVRVIALNLQLFKFLMPSDNSSSSSSCGYSKSVTSIIDLLNKIKECVDTYSLTLKRNRLPGHTTSWSVFVPFYTEELDKNGESLTTLIPDIQATTRIVEIIADQMLIERPLSSIAAREKTVMIENIEDVYLRVMKKNQFDTHQMISEGLYGLGYQFNVAYHFERLVRSNGEKNYPSRMKRLAQEAVTLSTSLPLSYSSSVFVRCDTDRLDVMKVLIIGPAETPYANGCFEFDVYFPPEYPNSPMLINLQTTGRQTVRFNPNLYNDGKVCLSILNTWQGSAEERWNASTASFLQVLVSIQSLILVSEPYFNEPGFERTRDSVVGMQSSKAYNDNIKQATVQWAMLEQIRNPSPCFKDVIHAHFYLKRREICTQIQDWYKEIRISSLETKFDELRTELAKLTPPEGVTNLQRYAMPDPVAQEPHDPASTPQMAPSTSGYSASVSAQTYFPAASTSQQSQAYQQYPTAYLPSAYKIPNVYQPPVSNFNFPNWQHFAAFDQQWLNNINATTQSTVTSGSYFNVDDMLKQFM